MAFSNTILVADDDPSTLKLVEYMLTRAGYASAWDRSDKSMRAMPAITCRRTASKSAARAS
jgi:DNA-binding response OmpR family regulator